MDDKSPNTSLAILALLALSARGYGKTRPVIVIDEGQNMPSEFYDRLYSLADQETPILMFADQAESYGLDYRYRLSPPEIEPIVVEPFEKSTGKNTSLKHVKRDWELRDRRGKKRR